MTDSGAARITEAEGRELVADILDARSDRERPDWLDPRIRTDLQEAAEETEGPGREYIEHASEAFDPSQPFAVFLQRLGIS